jgi:drug/metabolite transporter (DMT)-like permease
MTMKLSTHKGILWALATALISGVSVYVNKFGVAQVQDPFIYATLKNSLVAFGFLAVLSFSVGFSELRGFTPRQWVSWVGLGLIGGGIPFLLFFQGLAVASAPSAALIHKTLFIWVALLAVPLLSERLGWWQLGGLGILAVGQWLLQPPSAMGWGTGELLILTATLLWAVETILAKKVLAGVSAQTAALGRMGIGVLVMWLFLGLTGRAERAIALTSTQWFWVAITAIFLMAYVWTWYRALKAASASLVTSILTLGAVITVGLAMPFEGKGLTESQVLALAVMILGALIFVVRLPWRLAQPAEAT